MFYVVNHVDDYPEFVPYCKKAAVQRVSENVCVADLRIGFPPIHEEYKSKVTSLKPFVVRVCDFQKHLDIINRVSVHMYRW